MDFANITTNVFVMLGVYYFAMVIWRAIELKTQGHTKRNSTHETVCWVISLIVMTVLYLWRVC